MLRRRSFAGTSRRSAFPQDELVRIPCPRIVTLSEVTGTVSGNEDWLRPTRDQSSDAQRDALAAGCEEVFIDKASGKLARRPELDRALLVARAGDQLVVTKLDRLGRSLERLIGLSRNLRGRGVDLVVLDQGIDTSTAVGRVFFQILGAIAEFEQALMSERTMDGLAAAQSSTGHRRQIRRPHGRRA